MNIIISSISFLIVLTGFCYGARFLLFQKKPLYLKLLVLATGCYALEELSTLVNYLTDGFEKYITLGTFGVFGAFFFLFSVNYGTIDDITEEGQYTIPFRIISFSTSLIFLLLIIYIAKLTIPYDLSSSVVLIIMLLPVIPASYFTIKHILMKSDSSNILNKIRLSNIFSLVFFSFYIFSVIAAANSRIVNVNVYTVIAAISSAGISIAAVRGDKKWKI